MSTSQDRALYFVTEAVSDALDVAIEDLPPLSESISIDGLDALLRHSDHDDVAVTFSYAGLRVFVHSEGLVYVRPAWEPDGLELDHTGVAGN